MSKNNVTELALEFVGKSQFNISQIESCLESAKERLASILKNVSSKKYGGAIADLESKLWFDIDDIFQQCSHWHYDVERFCNVVKEQHDEQ
jgi:hypothetical protein